MNIDDDDIKQLIETEISLVLMEIEESVKTAFALKQDLAELKNSLTCDHEFTTTSSNLVYNTIKCTKCGFETDI